MNEEKKYVVVPEEISLLFNKAQATLKMRNHFVKLPFGYKRALRAGTDHEKFLGIFWKAVRRLYPEFNGKNLEYLPHEQIVREIKPND